MITEHRNDGHIFYMHVYEFLVLLKRYALLSKVNDSLEFYCDDVKLDIPALLKVLKF